MFILRLIISKFNKNRKSADCMFTELYCTEFYYAVREFCGLFLQLSCFSKERSKSAYIKNGILIYYYTHFLH